MVLNMPKKSYSILNTLSVSFLGASAENLSAPEAFLFFKDDVGFWISIIDDGHSCFLKGLL